MLLLRDFCHDECIVLESTLPSFRIIMEVALVFTAARCLQGGILQQSLTFYCEQELSPVVLPTLSKGNNKIKFCCLHLSCLNPRLSPVTDVPDSSYVCVHGAYHRVRKKILALWHTFKGHHSRNCVTRSSVSAKFGRATRSLWNKFLRNWNSGAQLDLRCALPNDWFVLVCVANQVE